MKAAPVESPRSLPWVPIVACITLISGCGLAIGGVYLLAGLGWALLVAAVPFFLFALVILRGLTRG